MLLVSKLRPEAASSAVKSRAAEKPEGSSSSSGGWVGVSVSNPMFAPGAKYELALPREAAEKLSEPPVSKVEPGPE